MSTLIANLGDASPFEYDGYFIFRNEDGSYEAEYVEVLQDNEDCPVEAWWVYQFRLDRCTYVDGVLSDNPYHPDHPTWFADSLDQVASYMGMEHHDLVKMFTSDDPIQLATAWRAVGMYHGFENLDEYPLTDLTLAEMEERYKGYDKL